MPSKKEEKIPLSEVKKLPYKSLNRMIKKMREFLKNDDVTQKMFKDYGIDLEEIDLIPMMFGNIDVSAKTDHGVIIFNYRLLTDGDFFKDFSYGVHEMTHWLQQTTGDKPTQSADDGSYLDNPYEQEGFQNQVEYIANQFGEGEAENYVDDLLKHHDIDSKRAYGKERDTDVEGLILTVKLIKSNIGTTMPFYGNPIDVGLRTVISLGDGYSITMNWYQAYPEAIQNKIAYNIYFSTIKEHVYSEGIKYISIDHCLSANIIDLTPGQDYFFSVRPIEYDPTLYNLSLLPVAYDNLKILSF